MSRENYFMTTWGIFNRLVRLGLILIFYCGCETQAYPDERISIDKSFVSFFNLFTSSDTLVFWNSKGLNKRFVMKIDSSKLNKQGWFINGGAHNRYSCRFREIGSDTITLKRENEVSVSKAPESNLNAFSVQFGNLFHNDTILPRLHNATIVLNNKPLVDYYLIKTTLTSSKDDDLEELYISPINGFFGFKMHSGEIWTR